MINTESVPFDKCNDCRGCIECGQFRCIYHSNGDNSDCYYPTCKYCNIIKDKPRMILYNVG